MKTKSKPFKNWNNFIERGQKIVFFFSFKLPLLFIRSTVVAYNEPSVCDSFILLSQMLIRITKL